MDTAAGLFVEIAAPDLVAWKVEPRLLAGGPASSAAGGRQTPRVCRSPGLGDGH
jgi:hypothetical protein